MCFSFSNLNYSYQSATLHCVFGLKSADFVFDRVLSVVISVESLMPLHSAIANARLTSNIAFDSTCWSSLSRGTASPVILLVIVSLMIECVLSYLFCAILVINNDLLDDNYALEYTHACLRNCCFSFK